MSPRHVISVERSSFRFPLNFKHSSLRLAPSAVPVSTPRSRSSEKSNRKRCHEMNHSEVIWSQLRKLKGEIEPPPKTTQAYPDSKAADAFQAVDQAVASLCAVQRQEMFEAFNEVIEGPRLDELLDALVSSDGHPALEQCCLMVLCGVASLRRAHDQLTSRVDVQKTLFRALAEPSPFRISPKGAAEEIYASRAVGAAICLNSMIMTCGGLSDATIKVWMELDALSAIASALESHSVFKGGGDEDVVPAILFGMTKTLLNGSKAPHTVAGKCTEVKKDSRTTGQRLEKACLPREDTQSENSTTDIGQRVAEACLKLLVERREWVARSLSIAANSSPSSGAALSPSPVAINNIWVNMLNHPDFLGPFTAKSPVRLRAKAISAARACEAEEKFVPGFAEYLARLLGLGSSRSKNGITAGIRRTKVK